MVSLYMTILVVGFISGVCMETCPAEDTIPCQCKEVGYGIKVDCACCPCVKMYDLQTLHNALSSLSGKKDVHLKLNYFMINKRLSNILSGIGIRRLEFQSCPLNTLNPLNPLESIHRSAIQNDIRWLSINGSSTVPPKLNLERLNELETIVVLRNNMTELRDDWLSGGLSTLEYLWIWRNNITVIGSNAFSKLINLKTLFLEDNRFGRIQRSMFPTRADGLRNFYLGNNTITELPRDLFIGMPSIVWVMLTRNEITTLDEPTWSPIWQQLQLLDLRDNNIACDDRLNWIIESKKIPQYFQGECNYPYEFRGMSLRDFLENRMQ